jgi:fructoselysine-6-P-deglycase FrlB-like protein
MAREIALQSATVGTAIAPLRTAVSNLDLDCDRLIIAGCGDSCIAGVAISRLAMGQGPALLPLTAMDLACYRRPGPCDLCVLVSTSGRTNRTLRAAERARHSGATTLAVTCNPASPLAQACRQQLILPYTPMSRATPHTLDHAMTLAALAALAERLWPAARGALDVMPVALCDQAEEPARARFAAGLDPLRRLLLLGAGPGLALALYGAAKFHEAGGWTAFAFELENFTHGPNFMLEPGDAVVLVATDAPAREHAGMLRAGLGDLDAAVLVVGDGEADPLDVVRAWTEDLRALVTLQSLCLIAANHCGLATEQSRAGRPHGSLHAQVQRKWMSS